MSKEQNISERPKDDKLESQEKVNESISEGQRIGKSETTNPKSENQKSEIENMEIHHHPDLHHKQKHFKEYFLEFLMIFLAVTLGFFAESYREYLNDRSKEKEYMLSMVRDLKADTANFSLVMHANEVVHKGCDSLIDILIKNANDHETIVTAYALYEKNTLTSYSAIISSKTISQLKNNGGFRVVQNNQVIDSVAAYDGLTPIINSGANGLSNTNNLIYSNEGRRVFDIRYTRKILDSLETYATTFFCFYPLSKLKAIVEADTDIKFMNADVATIGRLCNDLRFYMATISNYISLVKIQKESAIHLVNLIRSTYHLKDE